MFFGIAEYSSPKWKRKGILFYYDAVDAVKIFKFNFRIQICIDWNLLDWFINQKSSEYICYYGNISGEFVQMLKHKYAEPCNFRK